MDAGKVNLKMKAPLMLDFSNIKGNPMMEFPEGIEIAKIEEDGDAINISGDYAINYKKTNISEIKGNIVITSDKEDKKLTTDQLFWDQETKYFFTHQSFTFFTETDTIQGDGFESTQDLKIWCIKNQRGIFNVKE
jgi:LPS export ABC transporter protein LptC